MPEHHRFQSLRIRLVVPLVICSMVAAVCVAAGSYSLAERWATNDLRARLDGIQRTLSQSTFPMNDVVMRMLADLTQTELVTLNSDGDVLHQTVDGSTSATLGNQTITSQTMAGPDVASPGIVAAHGRRYLAYPFRTTGRNVRSDGVDTVVVLFDESLLQAARQRAAVLPLLTGLSTLVALTTITLILTERMVRRIGALQRRVELVAAGDFESQVSDNQADEVGRLGGAVDAMAGQLKQLWKTIHQQESQKLLHQIAGGMAHQLRNSLTGARLAIELHETECEHQSDEGIQIAIAQIEQAEDQVRRLLLVASGQHDEDQPMDVVSCLQDVCSSLMPVARHLNVDVDWQLDESLAGCQIGDGSTLTAAVSNLVLNAMQAADRVVVTAKINDPGMLQVTVADNGVGIPEKIANDLFEPFVTTKPEGLGLGLPLVRRAAERLGGCVQWNRRDDQTVFDFFASVVS